MATRKFERKRTMTLSWDGLEDDDDEFFEPCNRVSCAVPHDFSFSGDEEVFNDCRPSFSIPVHSHSQASPKARTTARVTFSPTVTVSTQTAQSRRLPAAPDYNVWMTSPESIIKRRQRLFQGMGLSADRELLSFRHVPSCKDINYEIPTARQVTTAVKSEERQQYHYDTSLSLPLPLPGPGESRSEGEIESFSTEKKRRQEFMGSISKHRLTKTSSLESAPDNKEPDTDTKDSGTNCTPEQNDGSTPFPQHNFEAFFLIKNLDTGKEFIVNEYDQHGMWNKLSDIQTGKQLTMDEFEKSVGLSPLVKELMSRENVNPTNNNGPDRKLNSYISKSLRQSKKKGAAVLKSIKEVANSMTLRGEKESSLYGMDQKNAKSATTDQWVRVRQTGKSCKELSALFICQEIQAHEGSIWTIKFSTDARFLATAGEDTTIHVWEVQECEVKDMTELCSTPVSLTPLSSSLNKKGSSSSKKGNQVPSYVHAPETVFSLSERPICSFKGHLDDVLDLSWSRSQQLLSASMDKTVRLWDLETKSCLKLFAHNDYVTCIHFNPMDDDYFISGSLDTKVRIWGIPQRQVVDWTELNEMVTAACYTPDGQGAMIGTQKGSCRLYSTEDCRLIQLDQITVQNKANPKKITGLQFCPVNPSELLVTSADSRIRVVNGDEVFYKFKGIKNTNSQIAASYTWDGNFVVSASEDSQVFVWRCEEPKNTGSGKRTVVTSRGHEYFPCKDVSLAIPWPGTLNLKSEVELADSSSSSMPRSSTASTPGPANSMRYSDATSMSSSSARTSASTRYSDSPSIFSFTASSSRSWLNGSGSGSGNGNGQQAAAWGLVIVTASLGGEIRIYQNFGLPRRVSRLSN